LALLEKLAYANATGLDAALSNGKFFGEDGYNGLA
jgi:hypothetical protein